VDNVIEPSELDMAELRHNLRQLYQHVGYAGSMQVLYEMMIGANMFAVVIMEEWAKERGSSL
jgi:hypothetical protein